MQVPQLRQQVSVSFSFLCLMAGNESCACLCQRACKGRQKDVSILHDAIEDPPPACPEASAGLCCLQVETDCFEEERIDRSVDVC